MNLHNRIQGILDSPSASNWLKSTLRSALNRDCVDAAADAELLAELLQAHRNQALGR